MQIISGGAARCLLFLTMLAFPGAGAWAALNLAATRVIVDAEDGVGTLDVWNDGASPMLVQTWMDDGDAQARAEQVRTPFLVVPPLIRVDAGKRATLRLRVADPATLRQGQESLYWLNVLSVPSFAAGTAVGFEARFQINVRSRLKVFYRPQGLPGDAATAPGQLRWCWRGEADGRGLQIDNPTAWYVNLLAVRVAGTDAVPLTDEEKLVRPLSRGRLRMPEAAEGGAVEFDWVADHGQVQSTRSAIAEDCDGQGGAGS